MTSRILRYDCTIMHHEVFGGRVLLHDCDAHFHDTYTIGLVRNGTVRLTLQDRVVCVEPGEIFLVHPYEVHGGGSANGLIECDILYPSLELVEKATGIDHGYGDYPRFASPVFKKSKVTARLFDCVDQLCSCPSGELIEVGVCDALRAFFAHGGHGTQSRSTIETKQTSISNALDIMFRQVESIRRPTELTEKLGVSPYHFSRMFHKKIGVPPSVFLRQLRVARARALITDGKSLAHVAIDAGFFDQAHMSREFKSVFGFPPGIFAKKARETLRSAQTVNR